ncbi:uncharacterized protein [Typha latifolia]|uniref:uncharacterized protein n=1 Tax=Typha latifolia TaxID=4733 RepID=UPI003C2BA232
MKTSCLVLCLSALVFFMSFTITSSYSIGTLEPASVTTVRDNPFIPYNRYPEVQKECGSILSSASKLEFDVNRLNGFGPELSFVKGDWVQEHGNAPLMPFDGSDAPQNSSSLPAPLSLASFILTHIDPNHHSHKAFNVTGVLAVAISRNGTAPDDTDHYLFPEFRIWPGTSELIIVFEGIYTESEKNGGESVLCLLGNALLPSRKSDSTDPWEWVNDLGTKNFQPPRLQDDQILLVLQYPKTLSLISRAVHGEMKSLNSESSLRYFDIVRLSSQLGAYSNYQFGSEKLISKACRPYPYQDDVVERQLMVYKGSGFCGILDRIISRESILSVVPNWNCNATDEYCSKLGPFATGKVIRATDGGFANVGLLMQDVRCESRIGPSSINYARVSSVFRVIPPQENHYKATQRSALNEMTLSAEGIWNSSDGQLCMVGCLGPGNAGCHSRICLYIPTFFSIKQRNIIIGRISSINNRTGVSHFPLSFEMPGPLSSLFDDYPVTAYKYSKIKLAGAFLERSEPFDFGTVIKKSLLSYPRKGDHSDELVNLSNLSDDLSLHVLSVQDTVPKDLTEPPFLQLEVLSLGSFLGRYWASENVSITNSSTPSSAKTSATERELLLNVSAQLTISGQTFINASLLYLEGLYNPIDGKMYLIGCRDVRASWKILFESMDLEDGLDCLIEVKIEYPPVTARWLINPTAKIIITSQRNNDDPLHFSSIKLQTFPIMYQEQREDILSRRNVEGILRILTLSVAIACICGQLFYIRKNITAVPCMSLVMLGVQALGYSIPLITGAEALFSKFTSEPYAGRSFELYKNQWFWTIDYLVKVLVLGAFLLTLRLGQKVWKSRIRLLTRSPLEPRRVPNDKKVLFISFGIHMVGFLAVLIVHYVNASNRPIRQETFMDERGNSHKLHEWAMQLVEYIGLIQDFFLLPQIIGNFLWQINCKPLRKAYYIGITVVRILPHVYDYIRAPVFNPYFSGQYEFVDPSLDFYSKFDDVAIPVIAAILAVVVYIQQKWDYEKLGQTFLSEKRKLLPLGSRVYERLPSLSFEAELVSGVNEAETLQKDEN